MAGFFSAFLTVFRFPAGRDSRVIKQNLKARILVALAVFCAVLFRVLGRTTPYHMLFGIMRTMTYIGLYIGWEISVSKRVNSGTGTPLSGFRFRLNGFLVCGSFNKILFYSRCRNSTATMVLLLLADAVYSAVFCVFSHLARRAGELQAVEKDAALMLTCSIVYAFIYASGAEWIQLIGGDITAAQCLMFTGILESCIQCGLIQTNTGYKSLFEAGSIGAQVVDTDYRTRYASSNAPELTADLIRAAETDAIMLDHNTLLRSSKINGGNVLWQEDVADITALLERLEENRKTIAESNYLEQENYKTKLKINTVREKNRLYDRLQAQTAHQIELLDRLLAQYETETDPESRRSLLAKAAVIGAYIKRRGNLMFIGERSDVTDTAELSACFDESFANLELMGAECAVDIPEKNSIYIRDAIRVYDFFEAVTEAAMDDIRFVWLKARSLAHENSR